MNTNEAQLTALERDWQTQQLKLSTLSRRLHACQVEFMETELEIGLTFASFALTARHDARKMARCERVARQAYNVASRYAATGNWSANKRKELARKTQQLERKLAELAARRG